MSLSGIIAGALAMWLLMIAVAVAVRWLMVWATPDAERDPDGWERRELRRGGGRR